MSEQTPQSAIFAFADEIVDRLAESNPLFATEPAYRATTTCCRTSRWRSNVAIKYRRSETSSNLRHLTHTVTSIGSRRP